MKMQMMIFALAVAIISKGICTLQLHREYWIISCVAIRIVIQLKPSDQGLEGSHGGQRHVEGRPSDARLVGDAARSTHAFPGRPDPHEVDGAVLVIVGIRLWNVVFEVDRHGLRARLRERDCVGTHDVVPVEAVGVLGADEGSGRSADCHGTIFTSWSMERFRADTYSLLALSAVFTKHLMAGVNLFTCGSRPSCSTNALLLETRRSVGTRIAGIHLIFGVSVQIVGHAEPCLAEAGPMIALEHHFERLLLHVQELADFPSAAKRNPVFADLNVFVFAELPILRCAFMDVVVDVERDVVGSFDW